jgi:hypothetical protein
LGDVGANTKGDREIDEVQPVSDDQHAVNGHLDSDDVV